MERTKFNDHNFSSSINELYDSRMKFTYDKLSPKENENYISKINKLYDKLIINTESEISLIERERIIKLTKEVVKFLVRHNDFFQKFPERYFMYNNEDDNLYKYVINQCYDFIKTSNCCCKSKNFNNSFECEQFYSRNCSDYDCNNLIYQYFLNRADRHSSELLYGFNKIEHSFNEYNMLEFGCGPAMGLVALDYFNKKDKKRINYLGIDNNERWTPIYDMVRNYSKIDVFNIIGLDITKNLSISFSPNIIVLNYLISWFYKNGTDENINFLYKNIIKLINPNKLTVIIINDIDCIDVKDKFYILKSMLKEQNIRCSSTLYSFTNSPTILSKYFDFWKIHNGDINFINKCKNQQLIITIGGEDDN